MGKLRLNRIKAVLFEIGMSSKDLAKKLKIKEQTVSGWCTNTHQPSLAKLFKIAEIMRVEPYRLVSSIEYSGYPEGIPESEETENEE